jgi:hypothetical protein
VNKDPDGRLPGKIGVSRKVRRWGGASGHERGCEGSEMSSLALRLRVRLSYVMTRKIAVVAGKPATAGQAAAKPKALEHSGLREARVDSSFVTSALPSPAEVLP